MISGVEDRVGIVGASQLQGLGFDFGPSVSFACSSCAALVTSCFLENMLVRRLFLNLPEP